ncbi:hypothetical protein HHI36_021727 [Cryptolaemus montrouzieri]|uniref:CCZ1/INTU/HSP4 first Longin domain-containing protein n=1 Tax=Cryptolaemus montrouzieri TaxID=559131 RepID=A0ABD2MXL6_9CUCU
MSKETSIVFIYDTKKLQHEVDDPATAILYFHPTWVSDQQKTVLCGQLMGIIHCLRKIFSIPKIISLESGKFCINNLDDRYLLAVGTDRNVSDWILLHRNNLLTSLIKFYHKDIEEMAEIYGNSDALSAKMYHMCETYLKIISFGGNTFSIIPTISLPKSASNVFIETLNILQYLQTFDHILGGLILYHNKVVATQLSPLLTKQLVLTDPYRIKSPAETIVTSFHLPIGVQLLQVYISKSEYDELVENSEKLKQVFKNYKKNSIKHNNENKNTESVRPTLKRDCSLLFTAVPEEDSEISPNKNEDATIIRMKKPSRPKFLNLKNKISDIKEITPSIPQTPYTGNPGSVISTPMTELNKVLHINTYSIVTDPEPDEKVLNNERNKVIKKKQIRERSNSLINLENGRKNGSKVKRRYRTISDPTYIFSERIDNFNDISSLKNELLTFKKDKKELSLDLNESKIENTQLDKPEKISRKKSLTLPLKSLSSDSGIPNNPDVTSSGLLTPLMQKLSSLAFEKRSSGIGSYTPTPLEYKDVVPLFMKQNSNKLESRQSKSGTEDNTPVKCILFICGQQDTVLGVLLKMEATELEDLINTIWEVSTGKLGGLEKQLHQCMDPYSGNSIPEQEPYSFLCLDRKWDTLKRGGPWDTGETTSLAKLHRDFQDHRSITEILCRGNDSILYGVHTGDSEIFYHHSESANGGLPTPSDSMGHVPMRAKRSLERDHAIVLL